MSTPGRPSSGYQGTLREGFQWKIDWIDHLRHLLQVLAFCLVIATIQYAFTPEHPYAPTVVYSLCIGTIIWVIIDLGRHLMPSSIETGWPQGLPGLALVVFGIAAGYLLGTRIADQFCHLYNWYPPGTAPDASQLRSSILITALAGIAGTYYFYTRNKSAYLQRKMTEARGHATEARLKLLETQLEPHMLFNTLANLRVLIKSDPARAQAMLDHLIAYLRATLGASRASEHALQTEFERLRDYLALMAVRMGARLQYTLDLPPELSTHPVPALLLQPLVENSIRHGLEPKVEGGSVTVSARREGDWLTLEVSDTGVGMAAGVKASGFGVAQVRERLATTYGTHATIYFVAPDVGGTMAIARLPYEDTQTT